MLTIEKATTELHTAITQKCYPSQYQYFSGMNRAIPADLLGSEVVLSAEKYHTLYWSNRSYWTGAIASIGVFIVGTTAGFALCFGVEADKAVPAAYITLFAVASVAACIAIFLGYRLHSVSNDLQEAHEAFCKEYKQHIVNECKISAEQSSDNFSIKFVNANNRVMQQNLERAINVQHGSVHRQILCW